MRVGRKGNVWSLKVWMGVHEGTADVLEFDVRFTLWPVMYVRTYGR